MANEKRLIDFWELVKECNKLIESPPIVHHTIKWERGLAMALEIAANIQPVDAVEVVRCKDCKHYFHYGDGIYGCRTYGMLKTEHDGFCSYGERKDDAR
jgi:hypothetical protein